MLLHPGLTCWRLERASRAAFLLDNATYFSAAKAAMLHAKRSIYLLGWAFDPLTQMEPDTHGGGPPGDRIGDLLRNIACDKPEVDVRVLVWKSALPIAASQHFFPHRARRFFAHTPVRFRLDASVPFGACHHQKVLVIDDEIAFCGGGDICTDRWDTVRHRDSDMRRMMPWGQTHGPRHEVMAILEGPVAEALGELTRLRWRRAGRPAPTPETSESGAVWPAQVAVDFRDVQVGIARTEPAWGGYPAVRETERLHLAAIAAARRLIYLENQYLTSPIIAQALAERLSEPDGPEVVLVSTARAPSWFDHATMDRSRARFLKQLAAADIHGRFRAFCPFTRQGKTGIIVHSKVAIIDDILLRAGSANLNNRSSGFDSECDVAVEAEDATQSAAIARFRSRLLAHYIGCSPEQFQTAYEDTGSLAGAIDRLDDGELRRLRPLEPARLGPIASIVSTFHLGDPAEPADSWRPWRRKGDLERTRQALLADLALARTAPGKISSAGKRAPAPADG